MEQPKISMISLIKFVRHYTGGNLSDCRKCAYALAQANLVDITAGYDEKGNYFTVPYPRVA